MNFGRNGLLLKGNIETNTLLLVKKYSKLKYVTTNKLKFSTLRKMLIVSILQKNDNWSVNFDPAYEYTIIEFSG